MERRLAAILSADVVGYSRLMAEDEDGTFAQLAACCGTIADLVGGLSRPPFRLVPQPLPISAMASISTSRPSWSSRGEVTAVLAGMLLVKASERALE